MFAIVSAMLRGYSKDNETSRTISSSQAPRMSPIFTVYIFISLQTFAPRYPLFEAFCTMRGTLSMTGPKLKNSNALSF